jgi:hypothetical protein
MQWYFVTTLEHTQPHVTMQFYLLPASVQAGTTKFAGSKPALSYNKHNRRFPVNKSFISMLYSADKRDRDRRGIESCYSSRQGGRYEHMALCSGRKQCPVRKEDATATYDQWLQRTLQRQVLVPETAMVPLGTLPISLPAGV